MRIARTSYEITSAFKQLARPLPGQIAAQRDRNMLVPLMSHNVYKLRHGWLNIPNADATASPVQGAQFDVGLLQYEVSSSCSESSGEEPRERGVIDVAAAAVAK
jgi:hypothetical protein